MSFGRVDGHGVIEDGPLCDEDFWVWFGPTSPTPVIVSITPYPLFEILDQT